jgi:hypothetical protein
VLQPREISHLPPHCNRYLTVIETLLRGRVQAHGRVVCKHSVRSCARIERVQASGQIHVRRGDLAYAGAQRQANKRKQDDVLQTECGAARETHAAIRMFRRGGVKEPYSRQCGCVISLLKSPTKSEGSKGGKVGKSEAGEARVRQARHERHEKQMNQERHPRLRDSQGQLHGPRRRAYLVCLAVQTTLTNTSKAAY